MENYEKKFLEWVAETRGLDLATTVRYVEQCISSTAITLGVSQSEVYSSLYTDAFFVSKMKGVCSSMDLAECRRSATCVEIDGKCYPRYIENADKINENPDAILAKMTTAELGELLKLASYLYYNYDGGGLDDNAFDAIEYHYNKRMQQRGHRYEKIGAPPVEKIRSKLPYPMASLTKVKPGSRGLLDFLDAAPLRVLGSKGGLRPPFEPARKLAWSLKLDGVSGLIVYRGANPQKAYTRGDGIIGGDASYLLEFIKSSIPVLADSRGFDLVVRGEFILSKKIWEEKYAPSADRPLAEGGYRNPRSFVSGKINSGFVSVGLGDISFVAYEIVALPSSLGELPAPSVQFAMLSAFGFITPDHDELEDPTVFDLMALYRQKRLEAEYYIDGLVLSWDRPRPAPRPNDEAKNPTHSVAFKMRLEEQIRKSKILAVEWNISRYGKLIPVGVYESVYIDGVRLHRASLFKASRVRDWNVGRGTQIRVTRSGDVIPTIIDAVIDPAIEASFPPISLGWHWEGADIVLNDIEGNRQVQIKRMEHFFNIIGVPGLREGNLANLWDAGYRSASDITNITSPAGFVKRGDRKVKGIGEGKSKQFYQSVHDTLRRTRVDRYLEASTTFKSGLGRKNIKRVLSYYPTIISDAPEKIRARLKANPIPGIGKARIENFATGIPKFREFLDGLNKADVAIAIKRETEAIEEAKTKGHNPKIKNRYFVFTGFYGKTDYELEDYIYDNQGDIGTVVSGSTAAVISANLMEVTDKMLAAQALRVPILSIEEFVKRFDLPLKRGRSEEEGEVDVATLGERD